MRVGDFAVDVVAHGSGRVKQLESGHVLARPGQVYRLRLRNFGPLYCVVDVDVDGRRVTAGGLVLEPWGTTELERPIDASEDGRFTVVAEGDESVFGADGGRENSALGLVEARFRRELPRNGQRVDASPTISLPDRPAPTPRDVPLPRPPSRFPIAPPEWTPSFNRLDAPAGPPMSASAYRTVSSPTPIVTHEHTDSIERAAGTGLTGHSDQQFVPMSLGPLESEATVIRLRLVIGTEAALMDDAPRPLVDNRVPLRPAPRP
jgi:hypothetical protein